MYVMVSHAGFLKCDCGERIRWFSIFPFCYVIFSTKGACGWGPTNLPNQRKSQIQVPRAVMVTIVFAPGAYPQRRLLLAYLVLVGASSSIPPFSLSSLLFLSHLNISSHPPNILFVTTFANPALWDQGFKKYAAAASIWIKTCHPDPIQK